jgi:5-methylthioadenosine/S-adenosylhomocysteine deaminase
MSIKLFTSEWVLPVSQPPIPGGAIAIEGDRIVFVGSQSDALDQPHLARAEVTNFGHAAILPGLINTHSHLELTLMRGFLEDFSFRDWIVKLTRTKYERLTEDDLAQSALLGAAESIRAGITTTADTGDSRAAFDAIRRSGLRGIAYREAFGPDPNEAEKSLSELRAKVEQMREAETSLARVGVSPHAPYTVSASLFRLVTEYARQQSLDMCIHAAEAEVERQMMISGTGEFAEGLRRRGIIWEAPGVSTIKYFKSLGVLDAAPLLVHCVRVDSDDISLIAASRARVAHCPKSNAKLGHGIAPLGALLDARVAVGLGTDSVASNNRADLISEGRFLALAHRASARDYQRPSADDVLRLATLGGARALGLDDLTGSLEPGKQADLVAIDLSGTHVSPVHDAAAAIIFSAMASDVRMTMVAGSVLFDGAEVKTLDEESLRDRVNQTLARMHSPF